MNRTFNILDWTLSVIGCTAGAAFLASLVYLPFAVMDSLAALDTPATYAVQVVTCDAVGECDADRPAVYFSLEDCNREAPNYSEGADSVSCVNLSNDPAQ
jgi:hypothetical protein